MNVQLTWFDKLIAYFERVGMARVRREISYYNNSHRQAIKKFSDER